MCLLPAWLNNLRLAPPPSLRRAAERLVLGRERLLARTGSWPLLLALLAFCAGGLWQLKPQNDLRQWLGQEPRLMDEARRIAELTGQQPTSQFFLVRGADEAQLLQRQAELSRRLDAAVADGHLRGYRALSQISAPDSELAPLRTALNNLPQHWQPLLDLGLPEAALRAELDELLKTAQPSLEQALAGPLAGP